MIADSIDRLTANWWTFLVRGIIALAFAAFSFSAPATVAGIFVYVVAAFFIISGLLALVAGLSFSGVGHWWTLIFTGVLQAGLGIYMLAAPGVGPLALAYLVAIWTFSVGFMEITSAIALRTYIDNEFWWVVLGILTVALGAYIVLRPDLGLIALVYSIGFYAAFAGIALIALGFRVKSAGQTASKRLSTT